MAEDALKRGWILILDVFFLRFMHQGRANGDEMAKTLLLAAQNQHFKSYVCDSISFTVLYLLFW